MTTQIGDLASGETRPLGLVLPRVLTLLVCMIGLGTALPSLAAGGAQAQTSFLAPNLEFWPKPRPPASLSWGVADLSSGQLLAGQRIDDPVPGESMTQLLTVYLTYKAFEERRLQPGSAIETPPDEAVPPGPRLFLSGRPERPELLLRGLLLVGAQDASLALARAISGSEAGFVTDLNREARALGLNATQIQGLLGPAAQANRSSVRDLIQLSSLLIERYPDLLSQTVIPEMSLGGVQHRNRNRLRSTDRSIDGLLASGDRPAAYLLATALRATPLGAQRQFGRRVLVVIPMAPSFESASRDALSLIGFAYQEFDLFRVAPRSGGDAEVPVFRAVRATVPVGFAQDVLVALPRKLSPSTTVSLRLSRPQGLMAPIKAGQSVGKAEVVLNGQSVHTVDLLANESVREAGLLGRAIDGVRLWFFSLLSSVPSFDRPTAP